MMSSYLVVELLIVATGVIIFVVVFCKFLQKWMEYVQEINDGDQTIQSSSSAWDVEKGQNGFVSAKESLSYSYDLPPKYEEIMHRPQMTLNAQTLEEQRSNQTVENNPNPTDSSAQEEVKSSNAEQKVEGTDAPPTNAQPAVNN